MSRISVAGMYLSQALIPSGYKTTVRIRNKHAHEYAHTKCFPPAPNDSLVCATHSLHIGMTNSRSDSELESRVSFKKVIRAAYNFSF